MPNSFGQLDMYVDSALAQGLGQPLKRAKYSSEGDDMRKEGGPYKRIKRLP